MPDIRDLNLSQRRSELELFARAGIGAVRPVECVGRNLDLDDEFWRRCIDRGFLLLSFGKASIEMADSVISILGPPVGGLVVTHHHPERRPQRCEVITAGHPVPDRHSLRAGAATAALIDNTAADIPAVVLISGGASSLVELPRTGVELGDLQLVNETLLRSGLPIGSMNIVRQALSNFKGGGLARLLGARHSRTLVISDVVGNDTSTIASGPMTPGSWRAGDPWELCPDTARERLPSRVAELLRCGQPIEGAQTPIAVIADAGAAARAALGAVVERGYLGRVLTTEMEGDAASRARWMLEASPLGVSISAGETTVVVAGSGLGGRNQHAALTWATEIDDPAAPFVGIAIGTDGRDGPTDAAGGLVDGATADRIRSRGGDPARLLANDDSHRALELAGDLIPAEPTGTNVGDLWIVIR